MIQKHLIFYCLSLVFFLHTNVVLTCAQTSPDQPQSLNSIRSESATQNEISDPKKQDKKSPEKNLTDSPSPKGTSAIPKVALEQKNRSDDINTAPRNATSLKTPEEVANTSKENPKEVMSEELEEDVDDNSPNDLESRLEKLEQFLQNKKTIGDNTGDIHPTLMDVIAVLILIIVPSFFFYLAPMHKLRDDWSSLLELIKNEEDDKQDDKQDDKKDDKKTNSNGFNDKALISLIGKIAKSLFIIITLFWLFLGALPILLSWFDMAVSGTFGDTFGFANAWFSGLALGGVILAILMQSMELRYQRKELKETRGQLERSADAALESQKQLTKQTELSFKSTYLGSLQTLSNLILDSEKAKGPQVETKNIELKLKTLINHLERDDLAIDLVADNQESKDSLTRKNWTQRLSHICSHMDRIYKTERANHDQSVSRAKSKVTIYQKQIDELLEEFGKSAALQNDMPDTLAGDLKGINHTLEEVKKVKLPPNNNNTTFTMGGGTPKTSSEAEYQNFWQTYNTALNTFKQMLLDSFEITIS